MTFRLQAVLAVLSCNLVNPSEPIWSDTVSACEKLVYLTVYPWYGNSQPGNIGPNMQWSYDNGMKQVEALGKHVVIGEIGWPSAGGKRDDSGKRGAEL